MQLFPNYFPIISFYPICKDDPERWKARAYLLKTTKEKIESFVGSLDAFLSDYKNDYLF
jgi:hypothetical protein